MQGETGAMKALECKDKSISHGYHEGLASFNIVYNTIIFELRLRDQIFVHKLGALSISPVSVFSNFRNFYLW